MKPKLVILSNAYHFRMSWLFSKNTGFLTAKLPVNSGWKILFQSFYQRILTPLTDFSMPSSINSKIIHSISCMHVHLPPLKQGSTTPNRFLKVSHVTKCWRTSYLGLAMWGNPYHHIGLTIKSWGHKKLEALK